MISEQKIGRTNIFGSRRLSAIALAAILLPILVFYGILARYIINLPFNDDYPGVLAFLEHYAQLPGRMAKIGYILSAQHNEYKTMFANFVIAVQYTFTGHPNFVLLSWLGNLFLIPLLWLLWKHFMRAEQDRSRRLLFFLPVPFLLFQLQYAETLNWSMPGLQNIPVLVFALACVASLTAQERWSTAGASLFLVLTIAASGNGFLLIPIGAYILIDRRRWAALVAWVAVSLASAAVYFHHYDFHSSQQEKNGSVLHSISHLNPIYTLSFMGSATGSFRHLPYISILLGLALVIAIGRMVWRRYDRVNPTVFYYVAFLLLTAIAVSGIRSKLGLAFSTSNRYRIYSDLLLVCCYVFGAESSMRLTIQSRQRFLQAALAASVLFCVVCDWSGMHFLARRDAEIASGVQRYLSSARQQGLSPDEGNVNDPFRDIMHESESTGLYRFP